MSATGRKYARIALTCRGKNMKIDEEKNPIVTNEAEGVAEDNSVQTNANDEPKADAEEAGEVKQQPEAEAEGNTREQEPKAEEQEGIAEHEPRMLSEDEVNRIVGKRVNEARRKGYEQATQELLLKYGVESPEELESIFRDGTRYGELSKRYDDESKRGRELSQSVAMLKSGILPERESDVIAILGAKGMDVTEENIAALLPSHKEWVASPSEETQAPSASANPKVVVPMRPKARGNGMEQADYVDSLGVEPNPIGRAPAKTDEERAFEMAGLKYRK